MLTSGVSTQVPEHRTASFDDGGRRGKGGGGRGGVTQLGTQRTMMLVLDTATSSDSIGLASGPLPVQCNKLVVMTKSDQHTALRQAQGEWNAEKSYMKKKTSGGALHQDGDGCNHAHEEEGQQPEAAVRNLPIKQKKHGQGQPNGAPQPCPYTHCGLTERNAVAGVLEERVAHRKDDNSDRLQ